MGEKNDIVDELYDFLESIKVNKKNITIINEAKKFIEIGEYTVALRVLKEGIDEEDIVSDKASLIQEVHDAHIQKQLEDDSDDFLDEKFKEIYPKELRSTKLERQYLGMILNDLKSIVKYYILFDDAFFADNKLLEIYKMILFTDGEKYAPVKAKDKYSFANVTFEINQLKAQLKEDALGRKYDLQKIYIELRKLFVIRKNYLGMPIKEVQDKLVEIVSYELYDQMTIQEVEDAVKQVDITKRFKQAVLNEDLTEFLVTGENNLTNGLPLPYPILTSVFKGVRKGETTAFAMPSNAGKSRFTMNFAANVAFVEKKKVLLISNEMTEDKMRLCLITTIINNEKFQKMHGIKVKVSESELLDFKFRPDEGVEVNTDINGYVMRNPGETQHDFANRLVELSTDFNNVIAVTDWVNEEIKNSLFFVNITDHTNDELEKIIINYYYKEKVEYVFYDTLKADTEHIGNGEEVKKTATILSNIAQNFNMYICSTLQLSETTTLPVNLTVNDLSASRTVKEVLDTLCLCKQIYNEHLHEYEYSEKEVDTNFYDLEKFDDPDVRYYSVVVDKNRAGAKPNVLFRLNLAYNFWEELGYVRLKQS